MAIIKIPKPKQHPGFTVQKVYDAEQKRLFKLTDKDYEDNKQHEIDLLVNESFDWSDAAVLAITALEKAAHDALTSDFQKYNQKMRQLTFSPKNNAVLARLLLNRELVPSQILNMSPNELKVQSLLWVVAH
ncbi:bromo-adjacent-like proteiny (BAH) domain-containing protein [Forsythia ovata]|uniref:Bromo-adjacent-like proteiny (BAH) domain-containing protein n=1 Tax=Forsythia ovata TaxID=205694 RepID=A0ABD1UX26_9LAMI